MLKIKTDSLDEIDEKFHDLYEKTDDGYQLKVEGVEDTGALKRAKDHEKQARKEAEQRLREAQEQLDAINAAKAQAEEDKLRKSGDIEALEKSWQEKYQKREQELAQQTEALQANLQKILVDGKAQALAAELAVPGSAEVLMPHIRSRLATVERDGEFVTAVLDESGKPSALSIDELKAEISGNKAFAPLLVGSNATGSGASPSASNSSGAVKRGDMGGDKDARVAALREKYPDL